MNKIKKLTALSGLLLAFGLLTNCTATGSVTANPSPSVSATASPVVSIVPSPTATP